MTPDSGASRTGTNNDDSACCKVQRSAQEYGISGVDDDLVTERREQTSYRNLADMFNVKLTRQALAESEIGEGQTLYETLLGDDIAESVYEILTTDDDLRQAELRARLTESGVNVDGLESAYVSYVTVRSHFLDCLGEDIDVTQNERAESTNVIGWSRTRAQSIIQTAVDRLATEGKVQTGPLTVDLIVSVTCDSCGRTYNLEQLIERRECDCAVTDDDSPG